MKTLLATLGLATLSWVPMAHSAETLVVGVENIEYLPHYHWDGENYSGFGADVLNRFAEDEGYTLTFRALPISRLMQALVNGDVDLKYPDNSFWSADLKEGKSVTYSEPVVEAIDGVMVLPENLGQPVDTIKRLGTVLGFTAFAWMDRIESGAVALTENSNFSGMVRQALAGRIDGAYANQDVVRRVLTDLGKDADALVFDEGLPHSVSNYHVSSATHPDVVEKFDAWMAANPDVIAELKAKHGL
ncbi:substrate-binding periplasmic protein [Epibacterium sp. Ofav1-8]|uniref:substrate-binding periplasmic protein n=1 Tax=Epibacterium sp. Ofav1-8 TaxID=2917735 RepID=UPI001EF4C97B|nr:transporter substrate-binding domain-containing protein [Epibacterium sp. Ofav1-8]MCG7623909.1 transporter substrate-binding domain-containing protein [Epibacterium sp. Ofav1-8]